MIDAILSRRSIRSYTPGDVTQEQLRTILLAGMAAPSALGTEPWTFVVIRDRELLERIPEAHPYSKMVPEAALAILVCHDERVTEGADWYVQDCAAATQNILLAISSLGLGAVWLGVHPREARVAALRDLLGLEAWLRPFSLIPIGPPGESKPAKETYKDEKVRLL